MNKLLKLLLFLYCFFITLGTLETLRKRKVVEIIPKSKLKRNTNNKYYFINNSMTQNLQNYDTLPDEIIVYYDNDKTFIRKVKYSIKEKNEQ
tara:strand:+ start:340 stop:615 length:276 start_codon:yes stop_codon:yes gene_type:complete